MRIVVTGGQGRLGTEVVRRLEARGATVTSASRRTGVDLATGAGLERALHGAECVVHAAVHRWRHLTVNLGGTRRLMSEFRIHSEVGKGTCVQVARWR